MGKQNGNPAPPDGKNGKLEREVQNEAWTFYENFYPGNGYKKGRIEVLGIRN